VCSGYRLVPKSNEDVGVNRSGHRSRSSRTHRTTAFLPQGMPRLPMPRYFSNGLLVRTGRTRTSLPSFSKSNLSPGRTPRTRRISGGTVICPLLVIRACFFKTTSYSLLYDKTPYFMEVRNCKRSGRAARWLRVLILSSHQAIAFCHSNDGNC
jgi:hypothetical protein